MYWIVCTFYILISTTSFLVFGARVTVCENSSTTLKCKSNQTIHIVTAMFGRMEESVCGHNDTSVCHTPDAQSIVNVLCDGKSECRIPANKELFGKFCGNIPSYADILYDCGHGLPSHFLFDHNKGVNVDTQRSLTVVIGILATMLTVAAITLAVIGFRMWRRRNAYYMRSGMDSTDELDWSLYQRENTNNDLINAPIYTGTTTTT